MKEDVLFKRTPFGGFDRIEVISYIQQLKNNQQKYKLMLDEKENQITRLNARTQELENEASQLKSSVDEYKEKLSQLEKEIEKLRTENEKLSSADAGKTVEMCDELVETASETASRMP